LPGQKDGAVRPDVDAEELLLLLGFLSRIDNAAEWDTRSSHLLDLVLDALRTKELRRLPQSASLGSKRVTRQDPDHVRATKVLIA
jgi:hypothetical protein